jgi:hexosaminidase
MESKNFPNIWNGAYSEVEKYEQEDINEIVEYARLRGIRVMIEFDVPGHAGAWCKGYPNICPSTTCLEPLNPATEDTFNLITGMFSEVTGKVRGGGLFPDDFLHLGGDEVDPKCWETTPSVASWMKSKGYSSDDAYRYFVNRADQITLAQNRIPVHWEEVFNHFGTKLDNRTVIHIWLDKATLGKVVAAGYRAILSDNDFWYLDHLETTWQQMYNNEPFSQLPDPKQQALVLGGEVCMWYHNIIHKGLKHLHNDALINDMI